MEEHERKHLSEVIDYDRDIAPYRVIEIVSGVGSGKNTWAEDVLMKKYHVLLITSRKAKVEETQARTGFYKKISVRTMEGLEAGQWCGFEHAEDCNIICNNASIEYYMKNLYSIGHSSTHIWNYFDIIILDEAHSLATDATFSDSPFHVLSFLRAAYRESKAKIILMTATPDSIKDIVPLIYVNNPFSENTESISDKTFICHRLSSECIDVSPKHVTLTTYDAAINHILTLYKRCKETGHKAKVVYFANHRKRIQDLMKELIISGLPKEKIAISFSDKSPPLQNEDGTPVFDEETLLQKHETELYISKYEDLPDNIYLFITTSRNKEGINLKNPEYQWNMIVESHYADDVKQMWGRVRSGLKEMEVVCDAVQYTKRYCRYEKDYLLSKYSCSKMTAAVNEFMETQKDTLYDYELIHKGLSVTNMYQAAKDFIKFVEETMPYIRYDIAEEKFKQYRGRVLGSRNYAQGLDYFDYYYAQGPDVQQNAKFNLSLFDKPVTRDESVELLSNNPDYFKQKRLHKRILEFLEDYEYLDTPLDSETQEIIKDYLFSIGICTSSGKRYSSLGSALKVYGFTCRDESHHKGSRKIVSKVDGVFSDTAYISVKNPPQ